MRNEFLKLSPVEKAIYKELYKKSFYDFLKDFWETYETVPLVDGYLVQFYCEMFQYMCRPWVGYKEIDIKIPEEYKDCDIVDIRGNSRNLNINVPPRHSKSDILNVAGPVWLWLNFPAKAASISHTFGLAKDMNTKRQKMINSEKFQFFFGDEIHLIANTGELLRDNRGGELYSKCRNSMTGFGCDLAICDDLTNAETARKDKEEMNNAWNFYTNTLPSRINDISTGVIINIQQRLAPNDITGHIMNEPALKGSYKFVILPAIFSVNTIVVCPISGDLILFKAGDSLWQERFGNYDALRAQVGESVFQTQYLQKPVASDRTIIHEDMITCRTLQECPTIEQADMIYGSHDFPVKDKETSDFLGSILAYKVNSIIYIQDCLEKRMDFVKSIQYVKDLENHFGRIVQIIEDKANGSPIIQQLRESVAGVQAFQVGTASKTQRLESASVYMPNVVFVKTVYNKLTSDYELSDNLKNLIQRLLSFPFVEHDDIVDAFTQLVLYVFMDRALMVYGRSFNEYNCIDYNKTNTKDYSTCFFNKDGDIWKVCEIVVRYGEETKIIVTREAMFKANNEDGLANLRMFSPNKNVFIDGSYVDSFSGIANKGVIVEHYDTENLEQEVGKVNLGFGSKTILIDNQCKGVKADIEAFKYEKTKDESAKFRSEQDGFIACIRTAIKYYGI